MSANQKAHLTNSQILYALREINDEQNPASRMKLLRELGKTNAPDVIKGILGKFNLTLNHLSDGGE